MPRLFETIHNSLKACRFSLARLVPVRSDFFFLFFSFLTRLSETVHNSLKAFRLLLAHIVPLRLLTYTQCQVLSAVEFPDVVVLSLSPPPSPLPPRLSRDPFISGRGCCRDRHCAGLVDSHSLGSAAERGGRSGEVFGSLWGRKELALLGLFEPVNPDDGLKSSASFRRGSVTCCKGLAVPRG